MIGVLVNTLTVLLGGAAGLLFRKGIPERVSSMVMLGLGACSLYIGISGALCGENALVLIVSVVLGVIVGALLRIDDALHTLAERVEARLQKRGGGSVAEGLVSATLLFCVGSMTVTGSLQAGLTGDSSILLTKSMLDLVSSVMLAASLGVGVLLSAVPVLVIEGGLALLAGWLAPLLSTAVVNEMTCVGSLLIVMIGTNLMGITRIKVADFLPAILFAPLICQLFTLLEGLIGRLA